MFGQLCSMNIVKLCFQHKIWMREHHGTTPSGKHWYCCTKSSNTFFTLFTNFINSILIYQIFCVANRISCRICFPFEDCKNVGRVKIRCSEMDYGGFLVASRLLLYGGFDHLLILYLLL